MRVTIRGEDHPDGPLELLRNVNGELILNDTHVNYVGLGRDDEALLVAEVVRYAANWDPEDATGEASLETLLDRIVDEHRQEHPTPEP